MIFLDSTRLLRLSAAGPESVGIANLERPLPDAQADQQTGSRAWGGNPLTLLAFVTLLGVVITARAAEDKSNASNSASMTGDLTGLSLQELYNLDIVQPNVLGGHTPAAAHDPRSACRAPDMSEIQAEPEISASDVFAQGFGAAHIEMEMDMHMFEVMHAPTKRLTLMAMQRKC